MRDYTPVIDISRHQGAVNFATMAAAGVAGVIIRAGNGNRNDDRAHEYAPAARAAGLKVGFYWFCNPKRGHDGAAQGRQFVARVKELGGSDLPLMADVEWYDNEHGPFEVLTGERMYTWVADFVGAVEKEDGRTPIIYTGAAYWNGHIRMSAGALSRCDLIVPRYPVYSIEKNERYPVPTVATWDTYAFRFADNGPRVPYGWEDWDGWQFSAGYNMQGSTYGASSRDLDLNIVKNDAWARWTGQTIAVAPEPQPEPADGYVVQRGDSWWRIAQNALGNGNRWKEVAALNGNVPLHPGMTVRLPGQAEQDTPPTSGNVASEDIAKMADAINRAKAVRLSRGSGGRSASIAEREAVRCLQLLLQVHGFYTSSPIDGSFGRITEREVRRFQTSRRIVVDGVVGPQTWGVLVRKVQ